MEFSKFNKRVQKNFKELSSKSVMYHTGVDKDELWNLYLDSFPAGTNEIFRERRKHDCSCCKQFIRAFGDVVFIYNQKKVSIWDFDTKSSTYQPVVDAMSKFVRSKSIKDFFITKEKGFGVEKNYEKTDKDVLTWHHFRIDLPKSLRYSGPKTEESIKAEYRENKNVFKRSLEEISKDSIDTVLDLIFQKSLYKGDEWKGVLKKFLGLQKEYEKSTNKDNFCWVTSYDVGPVISKLKNHSIGVLLSDISSGMDLNDAVARYEKIVAPTNYKRSKPIFTKKMLENAKKKAMEMGLIESLPRRHATIEDITINNILFANKDAQTKMAGDVFDDLEKKALTKPKNFDKVDEIDVETFVKDILPNANSLEVLFENKHASNLVTLIAPENKDSKTMFKWNNNFSWAYNGNITDSMKQRVKEKGGNIEGALRFSIQWNEDGDNNNDFDAHCVEPDNNKIYFEYKRSYNTGGFLDVDIIRPYEDIKGADKTAVENIAYPLKRQMLPGKYKFMVHNYKHRGGRSGFSAEIEFDDKLYSFNYPHDVRNKEYVDVAEVVLTKEGNFEINSLLKSEKPSKERWNIYTEQFHPVSVCMFSPNYWDEQKGIGNKHYFFMINDCKNKEEPNGFFNEFLNEELREHRKVFEALGSKMKVPYSDNQLSGLGFSSTKRNSLVCKVSGSFDRVVKVKF